MSSLFEGRTTKQNIQLKQFGYILSAIFLILTVVAMVLDSRLLPWLFIITLYILSGSMWMPVLIKPFYSLIGKYMFWKSVKQVGEAEQIKPE